MHSTNKRSLEEERNKEKVIQQEGSPAKKLKINSNYIRKYMQRSSSQPKVEFRRLDSLAKLIEGESSCAAVCLVNNQILATTNKIHAPAKKDSLPHSQHVVLIQDTLSYFLKRDYLQNDDSQFAITLLVKLCSAKIKGLTREKINLNPEANHLEEVITYLYETDATGSEWMSQKDLNFFAKFIDGLAEKSFWNLNERQEILTIETAFHYCWDMVVAFRKNQTYFAEHPEISDCKILAVGEKNEHAELRMMGYLLESNENIVFSNVNPTLYIGLAKLCCAECALSIDIVDQALLAYQFPYRIGITVQDSGKELSMSTHEDLQALTMSQLIKEAEAKETTEKEIEDEQHCLTVAGRHGLDKGGDIPRYFLGEFYLVSHFPKTWSAKSGNWSFIPQLSEEIKSTLNLFYQELASRHKLAIKELREVLSSKEKSRAFVSMNRTPSPSPIRRSQPIDKEQSRKVGGACRILFDTMFPPPHEEVVSQASSPEKQLHKSNGINL